MIEAKGKLYVSTGSTGHLAVTGTGSAGTGGSITGTTGATDLATNNCGDLGSTVPAGVGVYLKNTNSPSFAYMSFPGTFANFGILGYSVSGFTLDNTTMTGTYGDNVNVDDDTVHFCTLTGTASITNSTVSNGAETNLRVVNASGTLVELDHTTALVQGQLIVSARVTNNEPVYVEVKGMEMTPGQFGTGLYDMELKLP